MQRKNTIIVLAMLSFAAVCFGLMYYMHQVNLRHTLDNERMAAETRLMIVSSELRRELDSGAQLANFMSALLRINPELAESELDKYGDFFLPQNAALAHIIFAQENEVYYAYPRGKEEGIFIGYRIKQLREESAEAKQTLLQGGVVYEGPYRMNSGRHMLFIRRAVMQGDRLWGYAIVAMDFERLVQTSALDKVGEDFAFALHVRDNDRGNLFFLDPEQIMRQGNVVRQTLDFQNMGWTLGLQPRASENNALLVLMNNVVGMFFCVMLTVMLGVLLRNYFRTKEMAETDLLTGVMNRSAFTRKAEKLLADEAAGRVFFLVDLNRFKPINDMYGHTVGDALIIEAAHRLQSLLGEGDFLARMGGDEYIVLLRQADRQQAEAFMTAARQVMVPPVEVGGLRLQLSISIGCALAPQDGQTLEELYKVADGRMYADKERQHAVERY